MKKEERFSWILSSLQIIGFFDRKKYLEVFQVSPGQVTQDLDGFCDLFNTKKLAVSRHVSITSKRGILLKNERTGETSHDARLFWPLEIEGCRPWDVEDWFIRTYKEKYIDVQTYIMAPKSPEIFNQIVRAMVNEKRVKMLYDSPTSGEKFRTVSFLKVVRAVGRLHIFSYDHDKNEYRDFAVGRMLSLELQKQDSFVKTSPELINKKLSQKKELSLAFNSDIPMEVRDSILRTYKRTSKEKKVVFGNVPHYILSYVKQSLGIFPKEYKSGYFFVEEDKKD